MLRLHGRWSVAVRRARLIFGALLCLRALESVPAHGAGGKRHRDVPPIRNVDPIVEVNAGFDQRLHRLILDFAVSNASDAGNAIMAFAVGNMRRPTAARSPAQWLARYRAFGNDSLLYWADVDTLTPPPKGYSPLNVWPSPYAIDPGDTVHHFQAYVRQAPPIIHFYAWGFDTMPAPGRSDPLTLENAWTGRIAIHDIQNILGAVPTGLPTRPELCEPTLDAPTRTMSVGFALPKAANVELAVFDTRHGRVRELVHGGRNAGVHIVTWDMRGDNGRQCASGKYVARLEVNGRLAGDRSITLLP